MLIMLFGRDLNEKRDKSTIVYYFKSMKSIIARRKNQMIFCTILSMLLCCCSTSIFTNYSFKYNEPHSHDISSEEVLKFPEGFLWGAATASYQVEGGNTNSNWWEFEQQGGTIKNDDSAEVAADHYNRFEEDFDLTKELNLNSYRFSIEWSRIEPEKGVYEMEEIEHYRDVLDSLHKRGIEPMVTLWHFSLPQWFEDEGGWSNSQSVDTFLEYVELVVENLEDPVTLWNTINEPMAYIACTHVSAKWPPAEVDVSKILPIFTNLTKAHREAYKIIHESDKDAQVGIAEHSSYIVPDSEKNIFENMGAFLADYFWIHFIVGKVAEHLDFIGVHYYYKQVIRSSLVIDIFKKDTEEIEKVSLGRIYYPEGLFEVLVKFEKYNLPIYITEIGIPDYHEVDRDKFIEDHVRELYYAIREGVDVRGFYYWSLIDSFEWTEGYDAKFGLIALDLETLERSIKEESWRYAEIADCNCISNH